jgi:hypothetical protein
MLFNYFSNKLEKLQRFFLVLFFAILSVGCSKEDSSDALLITATSEQVDVFRKIYQLKKSILTLI